jgi:hypothetical protein
MASNGLGPIEFLTWLIAFIFFIIFSIVAFMEKEEK